MQCVGRQSGTAASASRWAGISARHGELTAGGRADPTSTSGDGSADGAARPFPKADEAGVPFLTKATIARDPIIVIFTNPVSIKDIAAAGPSGAATDAARRTGTADCAAFLHLRGDVEIAWRMDVETSGCHCLILKSPASARSCGGYSL
jgi:hypothetical protein